MSADAVFQVQKAVYEKLSGDATLDGMVNGVFDRVTDGTAFPYVVLGDVVAETMASVSANHQRVRMRLEVFSRHGGRKGALQIASRIHALLHEGSLSISGYGLVMMRVLGSSAAVLADGLSYRADVDVELVIG